jgi:hypothetical protein
MNRLHRVLHAVVDGAVRTALLSLVAFAAACPPPLDEGPALDVLPTGTGPNAAAVVACPSGPRVVVTASGDGRVNVIDPASGDVASVFLGEGSNPWDVAVFGVGDDARAVVTLSGSSSVALFSPCTSPPALLDTITDTTLLTLPAPITLAQPFDVDGDGVADPTVTQMMPRLPQAIDVAVDAGVNGEGSVVAYAAFTNILSFAFVGAGPMQAGPSTLLALPIEGDRFGASSRVTLPCDNAGGLAQEGGDHVVVSCAGRFFQDAAGHHKASPGGLVRVDRRSLTVTDAVALDGDTPGPIRVVDDTVATGDLLHGAVSTYAAETLSAAQARDGLGGDVIDSAFALVVDRDGDGDGDGDGALIAGWFDGRVQRDPMGDGPISAAPEGPIRGLVDLVIVDGDLYGLFALSAELRRIHEGPQP